MTERRVPTSTYRLQLHAGFGFLDAAAVVPYLSRLGISHLYLSPVLQAVAGSMHGYDVVDHSIVSTDLGGEGGLVELAEAAHRHDLAIVVDVVPNHMAIPTPEHLNTQLWDVLRAGQGSSKAHWFDVDWDRCDGRLSLPLLDSSLDEVLEAGGITRGQHEGESVLRYGGHVLPVAAGSESDDLEALLAAQHYLLAGRREKPEVLNYRRFFDVDTLIAIRVERDDVFDETHATLFHLYDAGVLDGFRIDHPDGLADPERYLERLHHRTDGAWVVVEKILAPGERLPPSWACAGTTGYDAIQAIQGALVPAVGTELDTRWQATGVSRRTHAPSSAANVLSSPTCCSPRSVVSHELPWPRQPSRTRCSLPPTPWRRSRRCWRRWMSIALTCDRGSRPTTKRQHGWCSWVTEPGRRAPTWQTRSPSCSGWCRTRRRTTRPLKTSSSVSSRCAGQ